MYYSGVGVFTNQVLAYKAAIARNIARSAPYTLIERSGIIVPTFSTDQQECEWFAHVDGMFVPKESGKYKFIMYCDDQGMFYLSENPLHGNPDDDSQYLLNKKDKYTVLNETQEATPINLVANKKYYYRFTIFNKQGTGGGRIAYVFNDETVITHIQTDCLFQTNCGPEDVDRAPFKPIIENDPCLGIYYDDRSIKQTTKDTWKVTNSPHVRNSRSNLSQLLFNKAYGNEDTACDGSYPHTYSVDFGEPVSFDQLYIPTRRDNLMTSNVVVSCDSNQILESSFTTENPLLQFDGIQTCTTLDIKVLDNTRGTWSSLVEIEPRLLSSTSRNIIPATHTKLRLVGRGELTRKGMYYNGKGFHVKKSSMLRLKLKLNETGDSFAIIGDKFERGGRFKVYIDGHLDQVVDTNVITPEEKSKMAARRIYQTILYGKRNLQTQSEHLIVLKVVRGEIGIAGFLADGNLIELPSEEIAKQGVVEGDEEEELPGNDEEENTEEEIVVSGDDDTNDDDDHQPSEGGTQILGVENGGETGNATEGSEKFQSETEDQKRQRQEEEERKRQEELQRVKEEAERIAREEAERLRKEEEERKRQEEEEKKRQEEEEKKRQEEEEKKRREEEEKKRLEEEERKKREEEAKKNQSSSSTPPDNDNIPTASAVPNPEDSNDNQSKKKVIIASSAAAVVVVLVVVAVVAAIFITKSLKHKNYKSESDDEGGFDV
ncbi:Immuno-dominant variable surface antigen-like [Trichomonas vaginalis G3]|uniref:Immuno-dominant variable surface antigen-like n=1 Tax=Trichomonas vaginalis (strain ATCC PRA-98 / G3) TaxID=412133 RepID=A2F4J6_TRIV3|nr:protein CBG20215-related family [Trichomonas vaginalis G3]EAY00152.1 Immuno-dominant variable surface antigen-like [Trichomonas vaginalis G3]KAI5541117.1 protein CBG20215-related family [Trichomonas vaginalis G3]|eukprot:XP_001313081.1 Immuno-dominant variable surface antigen-like [Trichomonas vaginalis G3]